MGFDVKLTVSRVADVLTKFENEATDSVRRVELRRDKKRRLKKK